MRYPEEKFELLTYRRSLSIDQIVSELEGFSVLENNEVDSSKAFKPTFQFKSMISELNTEIKYHTSINSRQLV